MSEPITADPPVADPPAPDPTPDPPAKTFSQEDVDRIVQDRVARVKREAPEDYESLKAAAAELAEIKDASKSELERLQEQLAETERKATQAQERAEAQLVQAAILSEGTKQNVLKPEHLHRLIDTGMVTVGDDGQVTGAEEAVKSFLEENPEYVGSTRPTGAGSADLGARVGGANQLTREDLQTMSSSEIVAAQKEGRLAHLLGAGS